jgi:type IV secretory pathway protease TraF
LRPPRCCRPRRHAPSTRTCQPAAPAVSAAAGLLSKEEDLSRRLRGLLESAVEAFGEERLVWAGHLSAVGAKPDKEGRSEPEAWYEKVREGLADSE